MTGPVKVALVGCGAIAQRGYLPAFALVPDIHCLWLVDVNRKLAETLARQFGIPNVTDDYLGVLGEVEAVILAVPNHLHAPLALQAADRGKAILCEKPLGRTTDEVLNMVETSERGSVPLVAGMIFRQYPGLQKIQADFPWDVLGRIREIRASYGCPLDWPVSNESFFDRKMAGGGVLLDLGVHLIDSLLWVLSLEEASVTDYCDDGESGVESEATAYLSISVPKNREVVPCLLEISRLRRFRNCIEVLGENASLIIPLSSTISPRFRTDVDSHPAPPYPVSPKTEIDCFGDQIRVFARRIRTREANCATADSQVRVHKIIESCYAVRQPLTFSWQDYEAWD